MAANQASTVHHFGVYEFDPRTGQLRKHGICIRFEGQPVAILTMLLKRPGELVPREELQKELWPADTFVDFEHSLNAAIKRLRAVLNDSAHAPRYVETLPGQGYRFIAPVQGVSDSDKVVAAEAQAVPRGTFETPARARYWPKRIAAMVGGLLLVVLTAWGWREWRHGFTTPAIRSLAVLPLDNLSHDPEQEYFADGMTDELITQLAQISDLRVISRTSVLRFKGTRKPLDEIARELNVAAVVEGTVARSAERVRVTAQVIQVNPEKHVWAESYDRPLGDAVILQGELARQITQAIRIKLTPQEQTRFASVRPVNSEAYEAFLKGRYFWGKRTEAATQKAIEYFQQAVEKDPNYALAFTGLADSYSSLALPAALQEALPSNEAFPKARAAADRALAIDSTLAEAHASVARIKFLYDRDWSGAEKEFQRAIELNRNYANAHHWYALELMLMGRLDEALNQIKLARELDPLSLIINTNMALILSSAQQYDQAIEQSRKALEMDPNFALVYYRLGQILILKGMNAEAVPELEKAIALSGGSPRATAELGLAFARLGKRGEALKLLNNLKERSKLRYVSPFDLAVIYGGLGDKDSTLEYLEKAYDERSTSLALLKLSPAFVGVRSDPRFADLLRRIGLPE
jgi:TolB-like protein/DNA-binding winged helix-turn-helix (wHTH) protein/Tfp pilus assembly protein PilF